TLVDVDDAPDDAEARRRYDEACDRLDALIRTLDERPGPAALEPASANADVAFDSSYARSEFEAHVQCIRDYIRAGDAFQVVLSQRLSVPFERDPFDLYRSLRTLN